MQQTTLQRTLQKKRASSAFLVLILGVIGCSSDTAKVYVNLSAIPLVKTERVQTDALISSTGAYRSSVELPELEQRDLFIGSAEEKAREALEVYQTAQEQAVKTVLARLEKAYTAEITKTLRDNQRKVDDEFQTWVDSEISSLRSEFDKHAEIVGALRNDLTGLVGFPDPDPRSIRVPPSHDKEATERFQKATALRALVKEQESKYKNHVRMRLSALEDRRTALMASLAENSDIDRKVALARAQSEARAVAQQALAVLERTALSPETQLPAVTGAQSSVDSRPVISAPLIDATQMIESQESLREQLVVFLKVMNYRLVDSPKKGRDATSEFLEWRQKYANKR